VDLEVLKFRKLERYLNKLEFNQIKIGSLLSQAFEIAYYNNVKESLKNYFRIIKFLLSLYFIEDVKPLNSKYIFTKLINRNHFNELMDPLIIHYLNQSTIICNENSFDHVLKNIIPKDQLMIHFQQTHHNRRKDITKIISVFFLISRLLTKNRKRLHVSRNEILFFLSQLIIQLKSVSYWDYYFSKCDQKPSGVITEFDRNHISSALISCARKHKIKTVTLTHGVICDYGFTPVLADYIFCWGNFQRKQLIEQGISSERIFITGNPLIKNFQKSKINSDGEYKIGFAISPESGNSKMIVSFISIIEKYKVIEGIIKLHPSLRKSDFQWIANLTSKVTVISSDEITNTIFFDKIDLLIIHQSGIANEALSSGIPVVIYAPEGFYSAFQYELINAAKCKAATNEKELTMIINNFLSNPNGFKTQSLELTSIYLKNLFETIDEKSVQSMIDGINKLIA
jgi:hypothetical protein